MPRTEAVYVVQVWTNPDVDAHHEWEDVATVTVPAKTKRRTVIEKVVEEASALTGASPSWFRVIPAEHAEPIKVEMEQPPPRLKIG